VCERNKLAKLSVRPRSSLNLGVGESVNRTILIAELDQVKALNLEIEMEAAGYLVQVVSNLDDLALHLSTTQQGTLLLNTSFLQRQLILDERDLSDQQITKITELLSQIKKSISDMAVVFSLSKNDERLAVSVLKAGADDLVLDESDLLSFVNRLNNSMNGLEERKKVIQERKDALVNGKVNSQMNQQELANTDQTESVIDKIIGNNQTSSNNVVGRDYLWTEYLPVGAMVVSQKLEIVAVNIVCQKLLDYSRKEICGMTLTKLLPYKLLKELNGYLNKIKEKTSPYLRHNKTMELTLLKSNGEFIPVRCSFKKLNLSADSPFILIVEDISEEVDSRASYLYQQKWDLLFADYSQYFITLPSNQFQYLIKKLLTSAAQLLACQRVSLYLFSSGSNHANLEFEWHERDVLSLNEYSHRIYFSKQMPEIVTLLKGKAQILYPQKKSQMAKLTQCLGISEHLAHVGSVSSYITPLIYQKSVFGWLGFDFEHAPRQWETTEKEHLRILSKIINKAYRRKKYEDLRQLTHAKLVESNTKLNRQACIDELTQLANRRYFDYVMEEEVRRASRDDSYLCVILCDIDYFKNYNDYYGHIAGDRCLKQVAKVLQESFQRAGDFVARYGGEEFAIILPRIECQSAYEAADKMRHRLFMLDLPHRNSPLSKVTLSAGITCVQTKNLRSIEDLIDYT